MVRGRSSEEGRQMKVVRGRSSGGRCVRGEEGGRKRDGDGEKEPRTNLTTPLGRGGEKSQKHTHTHTHTSPPDLL